MGSSKRGDIAVLVVDDEPSILQLFTASLDGEYRVITAESGEEALELLDDTIDVVLLDRRMPKLSGSQVLEQLRKRGYDVPVAMLTAVKPGVDIVDLGFDDYLEKPVSVTDVRDCVERLASLGRYDDVVREYYALASKVSALEAQHSTSELRDESQYLELLDRLDAIKEDAGSSLKEMPDASLDQLLNERTISSE